MTLLRRSRLAASFVCGRTAPAFCNARQPTFRKRVLFSIVVSKYICSCARALLRVLCEVLVSHKYSTLHGSKRRRAPIIAFACVLYVAFMFIVYMLLLQLRRRVLAFARQHASKRHAELLYTVIQAWRTHTTKFVRLRALARQQPLTTLRQVIQHWHGNVVAAAHETVQQARARHFYESRLLMLSFAEWKGAVYQARRYVDANNLCLLCLMLLQL